MRSPGRGGRGRLVWLVWPAVPVPAPLGMRTRLWLRLPCALSGGLPGGGRKGLRGGGRIPSTPVRRTSEVLLPACASREVWRRTALLIGLEPGGGPCGGARRGARRASPPSDGEVIPAIAAAISLRKSLDRTVFVRGSSLTFAPARPCPSVFSWTLEAKSMCHSLTFPSLLILALRSFVKRLNLRSPRPTIARVEVRSCKTSFETTSTHTAHLVLSPPPAASTHDENTVYKRMDGEDLVHVGAV